MPIHFELSVWAMKKGLTYAGPRRPEHAGDRREAGAVMLQCLAPERAHSSGAIIDVDDAGMTRRWMAAQDKMIVYIIRRLMQAALVMVVMSAWCSPAST